MRADYESMKNTALEIKEEGITLNNELTSVWGVMENISKDWHGTRINELIQYFNNIVDDTNKLLEMVVQKLPDILGIAAYNYSVADNNPVARVEGVAPTKVQGIEKTDVIFQYTPGTGPSAASSVESNISTAIDCMNSIESRFMTLDWEGEAAESFRTQIPKLKANIVENLNNVKERFVKYANESEEQYNSAETNTTL